MLIHCIGIWSPSSNIEHVINFPDVCSHILWFIRGYHKYFWIYQLIGFDIEKCLRYANISNFLRLISISILLGFNNNV